MVTHHTHKVIQQIHEKLKMTHKLWSTIQQKWSMTPKLVAKYSQ